MRTALAVVVGVVVGVLLEALAGATPASAHGMRTGYLELVEAADGTVLATWKTTVLDRSVVPQLSDGCAVVVSDDGGGLVRTFAVRCPGGIAGRRIAIRGLGPVLTEAVVRVARPDGSVLSRVLTPATASWTVPAVSTWTSVARDYVRLGVVHILLGYDHLLFLLALVLYVRRPRDVLVTESAFTLSHSVSFSATALGWVHVSARAAEACIALSLVLLALDVGRDDGSRAARRQAPAIALVFGLVHGLGFAGALSEVGLPDGAVATALVAFGAGVEIGQVAFLAVVLLSVAALARTRLAPRLAGAVSYLVGGVGSYWLVARLWACFA